MEEGDDSTSPAAGGVRRWRAGALSVLLLVLMFVPVYLRQGQPDFPGTALGVFTFLAWLPLTVRKRWPKAVLLTAVLVESLHLAILPYYTIDRPTPNSIAAYQPVPLATMVAVYAFASRSRQAIGWAAGVASGVVLLLVALAFQPLSLLATDMMTVNLVLLATAAGVYAAHRQFRVMRQERERKEEIRRNVIWRTHEDRPGTPRCAGPVPDLGQCTGGGGSVPYPHQSRGSRGCFEGHQRSYPGST